MKKYKSGDPEVAGILASRNIEDRFVGMMRLTAKVRYGTEEPTAEQWPNGQRLECRGMFFNGAMMAFDLLARAPEMQELYKLLKADKIKVKKYERELGRLFASVAAEVAAQLEESNDRRLELMKEHLGSGCDCESCNRARQELAATEKAANPDPKTFPPI